jgi:hypothetical protein
VMGCNHQFHAGCIEAWWTMTEKLACPLCKK